MSARKPLGLSIPATAVEELTGLLRPPNDPARIWPTLDAAAEDLLGWLDDTRAFNRLHVYPWTSSIEDFLATLGSSAPNLLAALRPVAATAEADVRALCPVRATGPSVTERQQAKASLKALIAQLSAIESLHGAWDDLVEGIHNPAVRPDDLQALRHTFWGVVRVAPTDPREVEDTGRRILHDDGLAVVRAEVLLGDRQEPSAEESQGISREAGLDPGARMTLVRRVLSTQPVDGRQVVWLGWADASLQQIRLDVGPTRFYQAHWIRGSLEAGPDGPTFHSLPTELKSRMLFGPDLPEGNNCVLGRVDLGTRTSVGAVEDARRVAGAVVDLAAGRNSGQRWRPLDGHLHAIDDRVRGFSSFVDPSQDSVGLQASDPTATRLDDLSSTLGSHLPAAPGSLLEQSLDAITWLRHVRSDDPQAQLLIGVRLIELVASWMPSQPPWYAFASENLALTWAITHLKIQLHDALHLCLNVPTIMNLAPEAKREQLRDLADRVIEGRRWPFYVVNLDIGIKEALPSLVGFYPETSTAGRAATFAHSDFATGQALAARIDHYRDTFKPCIARLQRCRNAIAHGGPAPLGTVRSLGAFGLLLADSALRVTLDGCLAGTTVADTFDAFRTDAEQRVDSLRCGADPASTVFTE